MRKPAFLFLMAILMPGLGCADKTPVRIEIANLPPLILKRSPISLEATVVNKEGKPIGGTSVSLSAAPVEVVKLSGGRSLLCLKTGDATLTASGGGLSTGFPVNCRIPTEIAMPGRKQFILGAKPVKLVPRVMTDGSRPMGDVPVEVTSSDPSVLKVEGNLATPVSIGKVVLKSTVGGVTAASRVEVVEQIVSGPLTLADGRSRSWDLKQGIYRVEIDVTTTHNVAHGVSASWQGPTCATQPERQSHRFSCDVPASATFSVTNPATHGLGLPVSGKVSIYRVPAI